VLFGIRTIAFGLSLLWRGGRTVLGRARAGEVPEAPEPTAQRPMIKAMRWVAAVVVLALTAGTLWCVERGPGSPFGCRAPAPLQAMQVQGSQLERVVVG
jgi:hypothetical protein